MNDVGADDIAWSVSCEEFQHTGSVGLMDLNDDGTPDVVVNSETSGDEWPVAAIDGSTGRYLWVSDVSIEMVTVPAFGLVNDDDVPDVLVGGRGLPSIEPLVAIDGRTGELIWRVEETDPVWQNVYTPQQIGDVDDDGIADWVVSTGGDHVRPNDVSPETGGRLVVVGGLSGKVLASVELPGPQEIYSSPIVIDPSTTSLESDQGPLVVVGSGGEVFPGALWSIPLESLIRGDGSAFEQYGTADGESSFIAPASGGDLNGDNEIEIVSVRLDGVVESRSPWTGDIKWTARPATRELEQLDDSWTTAGLAAPAIGQLDEDSALEVVVLLTLVNHEQLAQGNPYDGDTVLSVIDGSTGLIEHQIKIADANSVISPLIATVGGTPVVLCGCARTTTGSKPGASAGTTLGLWGPAAGTVTDLDRPAELTMTPALFMSDPDSTGPINLVSGGMDGQGSRARWVLQAGPLPGSGAGDEIQWGTYMGSSGTGLRPRS